MPTNTNTLKKYLNPIFMETGCGLGDGIQSALNAGFNKVCSLEASMETWLDCVQQFKDNPKVEILLGDTRECLYTAISRFMDNITFWLDAHNPNDYPVLAEIDQIGKHYIKTHTILIDDLRMFPEDKNGLTVDQIKEACLKINPDYKFKYEDGHVQNDILVCFI
jgi:hypothetical protein